jgi:hypothetical protein
MKFETQFKTNKAEFQKLFACSAEEKPELYLQYLQTVFLFEINETVTANLPNSDKSLLQLVKLKEAMG